MKHLPEEKCWIVDHSVTYWTILGGPNKGKVMRFPVYNGKGPEIDEEELYSNIPRPESGPRIAQRYCVVVPAGEVEKTVRDIMDFYSKNILKDTDILRSFGDDTCDPKVQSSCEIFTGNIYAFGPEGFTIDGFDGTYGFGIYFPSIPGKAITVRNVWDIPIAETGGWEDETNRKNRKDAIIKWHLR
ncbi:MAG: hypothetical protein JJT78_14870 [Leptospira sp.]|nr:hypothetical protein [Leptospira sp.]